MTGVGRPPLKFAAAGSLVFRLPLAARLTFLSLAAETVVEVAPVWMFGFLASSAVLTGTARAAACWPVRQHSYKIHSSAVFVVT